MADDLVRDLMGIMEAIEARVIAALIDDAAGAAEHAAEIAPIYSGGYEANIRAALNTDDVPVDPSEDEIRAEQRRIARGEIAPGRLALPPAEIGARARDALRGLSLGDTVYVANAVSYAGIIEDRGTATVPGGNVFRLSAEAMAAAFEARWR